MSDDKIKKPIDILQSIDDKKNKVDENISCDVHDPMNNLRNNLMYYIDSLIRAAIEDDELIHITKAALIKEIPNLSFRDLHMLFKTLISKKETINDKLTSLLRPNQDTSLFLEALSGLKKTNNDVYEDAYKHLSSEEMQTMDAGSKVYKLLSQIAEKLPKDKDDSINSDPVE